MSMGIQKAIELEERFEKKPKKKVTTKNYISLFRAEWSEPKSGLIIGSAEFQVTAKQWRRVTQDGTANCLWKHATLFADKPGFDTPQAAVSDYVARTKRKANLCSREIEVLEARMLLVEYSSAPQRVGKMTDDELAALRKKAAWL